MLSLPRAPGTNPNITNVLEDITGPALKREEGYSRITITGQELMCTSINVDGIVMLLEVPVDTISDFETLQQQMPSSTPEIMTSIKFSSVLVQAILLALSASKTDLLCGITRNPYSVSLSNLVIDHYNASLHSMT
jgi:hypothetical protein